jgi:hypothetical protein
LGFKIKRGKPMHEQLDELLNRRMDRSDFLRHVGIGVLILFGLGSLAKLLSGTAVQQAGHSPQQSYGAGYGGNVYGGGREA